MNIPWNIDPQDVTILRDLYRRKRDISQDPIMQVRKDQWKAHSALHSFKPMILAETQGVLDELVPLKSLQCHEPWAREIERQLRDLIFRHECVGDDYVVEPWINVGWHIETGTFGFDIAKVRADNDGKLGSYHWDPPIKHLDADLSKLCFRSLRVNRDTTLLWKVFLEDHFGDILPVRIRAAYWWTTGLTWTAIDLIGMETLMTLMYDNPAGLHRLMSFLSEETMRYLDWFEREGLLTLNNENDYVGSGGIGYTDCLPTSPQGNTGHAQLKDLWGLSESQETVGVSPAMFEEFVFQYQIPIANRFGFVYYGCCEPIHNRIKIIKHLKNLRSLSVSPWCNQELMADELGADYIFCRKPNPAQISTGDFDEKAIRDDIHTTLRAAGRRCPLEFAMKDVHTLNNEPSRPGRWVTIAREMCSDYGF